MNRLWRWRFRRTTMLLILCLAILCGVGLAHGGVAVNPASWLLALLPTLFVWRRRDLVTIGCIVTVGVGFGCWRGTDYMTKLAAYQPLYLHKITITATASNDAVYGKNSQLSFDAGGVKIDGRSLSGKLQLSGFGLNAVYQGDTVRASGTLYPGFGAYQGRISFAQLAVTAHHPSLVADIRRKFTASVQSVLPEPLAPFAMGLLIGQRASLPPAVKQDLLMVGLTHIIAVSGYNLTIMLEASRRLLAQRSKRLTTGISLALLASFLLLAGASASIIRAAIVSLLSIAAGYYGRTFRPLNLIALAAAVTAWANPFYIWSDTSWYLSFLAFFGVMVLAPAIASRLRPRWRESLVVMVALESLCAEVMTLPFVLHTFGQMSLIGLPANVLVVTLVPLAMLLSLLAGLGGMLAAGIAGWFAWPARLLLSYMLDIAHLLATIPHVFLQHIGLSTGQMIVFYLLILLITALLWHKTNSPRHAKVTDRDEPELEGA